MIIDKMRHNPRREALRDALQQLHLPTNACQRLSLLGDAVHHPMKEEVEVFLKLRNRFSNIFNGLMDRAVAGNEFMPEEYVISLSAGFGPLDEYYKQLPGDAQRPDGYRWETLLMWTWRIHEHGLEPSCGSCAWESGYNIPPWPASQISVGFLAPITKMHEIYAEEIELSSSWHFEFVDPEVVEGLGIARRHEF